MVKVWKIIKPSNRQTIKQELTYLKKKGVDTAIHYPVPIHMQTASKSLGYKKGSFPETESQSRRILTLPVNQYLKKNEILYICKLINNFYS